MKHLGWALRLALLVFVLAPALMPAAVAGPPPAAAFYSVADLGKARLSPSGRWLAVMTALKGARAGISVIDLQDVTKVNSVARFDDIDIKNFWWVNDERLVFDTIDWTRGGADQKYGAGLFSVKRDGSDVRTQIKLRELWVQEKGALIREPLSAYHYLMHVPRDGSHDVIVGEDRYDNSGEFVDVLAKRLNILTGEVHVLAPDAPAHVVYWMFDAKGEPRLVVTQHAGREGFYWHTPGTPGWALMDEHDYFRRPYDPLAIDGEGHLWVTRSEGAAGDSVLVRYDFAHKRPEAQALVSTPGFDFQGDIVSETPGSHALGVRTTTDAETTVWFDARLRALQQEVDKRLPEHVNEMTCVECDSSDMVVLIHSWSDRDPGRYFVYKAKGKTWQEIGPQRVGIDPNQMGTKDFYRTKARDGEDLPVWVTFPPGARQKMQQPAVVLVHGGPWSRGTSWHWEQDAQFLATRGYVVIEPEFRGSLGYGETHYEAGFKQWGLRMQDDVADALQWAVKKGWVDGRRACIAGASYGGYATLMGLVRQPDLYRCGMAWVPVSDPRLMMKWAADSDIGEESRNFSYPTLVGDPVKDAALLADAAAPGHAAEIKAPLLMVVGGGDERARREHFTLMRDALEKAGHPAEWKIYADEGHGWTNVETRIDFAGRMERFLAHNLAPAGATAASAGADTKTH